MKLHLGCGERYLEGYLNIDFPPASHTVQTVCVADLSADITTLNYPAESLDEVRLHHVFEHFSRPVACGLLACWYSWLKPGAVLHIEVPDFSRTSRAILNPFNSFKKRAVAERHIFGSHEASWAVHCEGYTLNMLEVLLSSFGYDVIKVNKSAWLGTYNIEVTALRDEFFITKESFISRADEYLKNFLVDQGEQELRIHSVWMTLFSRQLAIGWAQ